ncbi:MAG: thioredoxin-related protein [Gammaproteobacteria bacterium]|jgi:thioredoxin-related protein
MSIITLELRTTSVNIWLRNLFFVLICFAAPGVFATPGLETVDNLSLVGDEARQAKLVVIVLVTQPDCSFCEYVKSHHIEPMIRNNTLANIAVIRELDLEGISVTDFSGAAIEPGEFARRYDAEFSPSVLFLSADGAQLHEPIIGVGSRDYYGYYLDQAIEKSAALIVDR